MFNYSKYYLKEAIRVISKELEDLQRIHFESPYKDLPDVQKRFKDREDSLNEIIRDLATGLKCLDNCKSNQKLNENIKK
jgi:Iap family predicted aminopeptidase